MIYGKVPIVYWHWLVIYGLLLALGLLGDVSSCAWGAMPVVWAQLMPQIHYLGIVFAATRFGAPGGLAAACVVGVAHTMLLSTACNQATAASGHLAMFAAVGLLAGWIGKLGVP